MCVMLIAINVHSDTPLLVLHNRDEFIERLAYPLALQEDGLYFGTDTETGGTWFGLATNGNFAALTNIWDNTKTDSLQSRGKIIPHLLKLKDKKAMQKYLNTSSKITKPFNLIFSVLDQYFYFNSTTEDFLELASGIYVLAVNGINEIRFKCTRLEMLYRRANTTNPRTLLKIMNDKHLPESPDLHLKNFFPDEVSLKIGAIFVDLPTYRTRCTTILTKNNANQIDFSEYTYNRNSEVSEQRHFKL